MKNTFAFLLLSITSFLALGQNAFYDAIYLNGQGIIVANHFEIHITDSNRSKIEEIFKRYVSADDLHVLETAINIGSRNPFISISGKSQTDDKNGPRIAGLLTASPSAIGGLNATTVADGIARFLVERTKQELDTYFFDQFNEFLNNSDYGKDLKVLFPNTYSVMLVAKDEIYNYQQYLQAFREAFTHDLTALLTNTNTWINQSANQTSMVKAIQNLKYYPYIQLTLQIAVDVQQGKHPGDILGALSTRSYIEKIGIDSAAIVKIANLFSQSLRSTDSNRYWINENEFTFFNDTIFLKIYLGLIYQQALVLNVTIGGKPLTETLGTFSNDINRISKIQSSIDALRPQLTEIDQALRQLKSDTQNGTTQNYLILVTTIPKVLETVEELFSPTTKLFAATDTLSFFVSHTANLLGDIRTKTYSAAVVEFVLISKEFNINKSENFLSGLLKYGSFMANVTSAKTPEEVKNAIEVVALPAGSYRIKRESRVNISLNSYVGLYAANENMPASQTPNRFSAGVFAPIGFAFSLGGCKCSSDKNKGGKSISLFTSLIDVGALAAFRFNDSNTAVSSNIDLKNIVAPGLFIVYGFGKSPISIGAGIQGGPKLRNIDPSGAPKINDDYYLRIGGFAAVDIPLLNVYNRKDKKIKKENK